MPAALELTVPATRIALIASLETIGEFCTTANLRPEGAARVLVVVEELFLNTINHGYAAECERPVSLRLDVGSGALTLTYEDAAPRFDPIAWMSDGDRASATRSLREGGAGLDLLMGLSRQVIYEALEIGNRLTVVFEAG